MEKEKELELELELEKQNEQMLKKTKEIRGKNASRIKNLEKKGIEVFF